MNYFFKFLLPQLLKYFENDKEIISKFIPKVVYEKYKNELKCYIDKNAQF